MPTRFPGGISTAVKNSDLFDLISADAGVLVLTNAAGDNDLDFLQMVAETFLFEVGKKLWFKARFKVSDATQSDFIMGLQITDTSALAVSDGVFFQKDDGDTALDFHVEKNGTATSASDIATIVDDTYLTVGFYYDVPLLRTCRTMKN